MPVAVDANEDGIVDTLENAARGARALLEITTTAIDTQDVDADGDTTEACAPVGTYTIFFDIVAEGGVVVSTETATVEVELAP